MNKVRGLYGAYIDRSRACGFCHSKKHKAYMTPQMVQAKKCFQKQCKCLEVYEDHEWIKQRKLQKQRKKANKQINDLLI